MSRGRRARLALLAGFAAAIAACAHPGRRPEPGQLPQVEVGLASYYARSFQGHRTASGERYDRRAMTCAHRRHPFGTRLRVTDLETGRKVVVEVTDRGPFTHNRLLDLSWAAARELGILERGVARVRVEVIGREDASLAPEPADGSATSLRAGVDPGC